MQRLLLSPLRPSLPFCRTSLSLRDNLHPGTLCGAILSATTMASTFPFRPSPPWICDSTSNLSFNFEIQVGLCLVTAWAIPRASALWAAPPGAARYNQLSRAIKNKHFQYSGGPYSPPQRPGLSSAGKTRNPIFTLAHARSSLLIFGYDHWSCDRSVTAWAIPRVLWAAPVGAARYNQLSHEQ